MEEALVSLIVPCYNISNVCEKFFESLLFQTYTNIQLIIVNDGSTDETEAKIKSYQSDLENKGFILEYIYQQNRGLGGAINTGLKRIKGNFFCWADPDDHFESNAFELRINYMWNHPECAVLTCDAYIRQYGDLKNARLISNHFPHSKEPKQFKLLLDYDSIFCSGCHMIRTAAFLKVNPQKEIYEARRGQNWQLLLPIYYVYDRHFLPVPVYDYIIYPDSMSHSMNSYNDYIKRYAENKEIITQTLQKMDMPTGEKNDCIKYANIQTTQLNMYAAMRFKQKADFRQFYRILSRERALVVKDRLRWLKLIILDK